MSRKSRRASRGHAPYRRKNIAGREPSAIVSTDTVTQTVVPEQMKSEPTVDVRLEDKRSNVLIADWRRTLILGGFLLFALIFVSLILRYTFTA